MGVRPYDGALGRFLAVDAVEGGALNGYDYAGQDPINELDLLGTHRCPRRRVAICAAKWHLRDHWLKEQNTLCLAGKPNKLPGCKYWPPRPKTGPSSGYLKPVKPGDYVGPPPKPKDPLKDWVRNNPDDAAYGAGGCVAGAITGFNVAPYLPITKAVGTVTGCIFGGIGGVFLPPYKGPTP